MIWPLVLTKARTADDIHHWCTIQLYWKVISYAEKSPCPKVIIFFF